MNLGSLWVVQAKAGITQDIIDALSQNNATLSKMRRKRVIPETQASVEEISRLDLAGSFPIHKTTQVNNSVCTHTSVPVICHSALAMN